MRIDITLEITANMMKGESEAKAPLGHTGTHFDVMEKEFPLDYTRREGVVLDVSHVKDRDIDVCDADLSAIGKDMFVMFYTGYIETVGYAEKGYFTDHPQLSDALIGMLLEKGVSLIGVDFAGIRRGKEHIPKDRYCADRNVFVIENLCGLKAVLDAGGRALFHTYPMRFAGMTGLPCRVIAEI
ncbi:MAG: cyclase family protein [Clostridia bacterium]|nr:cyclase family protein [Clostridia bacterium]